MRLVLACAIVVLSVLAAVMLTRMNVLTPPTSVAFQRPTAEAIGTLLDQLKLNGYKIVHITDKDNVTTLPEYDEMLLKDQKLPTVSQRPTSDVVRTINQ